MSIVSIEKSLNLSNKFKNVHFSGNHKSLKVSQKFESDHSI